MDTKKGLKITSIVGLIVLGIIIISAVTLGISRKTKVEVSQSQMPYEIASRDYDVAGDLMEMSTMPSSKTLNMAGEGSTLYVEDDFSPVTEKKVIKSGNLTLNVERIADAQEKIAEIAKGNGGDIFSSNIYQAKTNVKSGQITVKVPVANFEKAFEDIKSVSTLVVREMTSGMDVTEQYQDLQTRIKNKQAEEEAYLRIFNQAQKVSDILDVQGRLSQVRGEIERLQGQLKYMQSQTDMSTITVSLSEDQDITVVDSWRPLQVAKDAVNALVKSVQGFVNFIIIFAITFLPTAILYLLLVLIIFWIVRKIWRRFRKKKLSE